MTEFKEWRDKVLANPESHNAYEIELARLRIVCPPDCEACAAEREYLDDNIADDIQGKAQEKQC